MGVVHGGGWFIRSSHVALIYSPKPRIYFIHYAFPGADLPAQTLLAGRGVGVVCVVGLTSRFNR